MVVAFTTVKLVAGLAPKVTAVAPLKPVPVMVRDVPPCVGPEDRLSPETTGAERYVYWLSAPAALVPPGVVIATFTAPALPAGAVAAMVVAFTTLKLAGLDPNVTTDAPLKPVPVMATEFPPDVDPEDGKRPVTVGAATYVKMLPAAVALVPPPVVTLTFTEPALPAGEVAVMVVAFTTVKELAATAPN
jgi:hypothetical protein